MPRIPDSVTFEGSATAAGFVRRPSGFYRRHRFLKRIEIAHPWMVPEAQMRTDREDALIRSQRSADFQEGAHLALIPARIEQHNIGGSGFLQTDIPMPRPFVCRGLSPVEIERSVEP
jgi:hypothetical protein